MKEMLVGIPDRMLEALDLAKRGRYHTRPNPMVGCVIESEQGEVIASGWHQYCGGEHAEAMALAQMQSSSAVAHDYSTLTCYVTLEPCCHQGRQPPCVDKLIQSGIKNFVIGSLDPNSKVSGRGINRLRQANANVTLLDQDLSHHQSFARRHAFLNRGYLSNNIRSRPWVTAKAGISLDGNMALSNGTSQWITNIQARQWDQSERAEVGAILTGTGTIRKDLPKLTVRPNELSQDNRQLLLAYPHLDPERLVAGAKPKEIMSDDAFSNFHFFAKSNNQTDEMMDFCFGKNINRILIEAGPKLLTSWFEHGVVDEWLIFIAPIFLGQDAQGISSMQGLEVLDKHIPNDLQLVDILPCGNNIGLRYIAQHAWDQIIPKQDIASTI